LETKPELFNLDAGTGATLAKTSEFLGQLNLMSRLWPLWDSLVSGPWTAVAAWAETDLVGHEVDFADLLAEGPEPSPSRPGLGMRWAVGITLCLGRLAEAPLDQPLTPSLVGDIFWSLNAPHLSRHTGYALSRAGQDPPNSAPVWTQAKRWREAGLAPLFVAGLALASWEREGPDHPHRSPAGRILLSGLAARMGLPDAAFRTLGLGLQRALGTELEKTLGDLRRKGNWRVWLGSFLAGLQASSSLALEAGLQIRAIHEDHRDLIKTWVRAPRHPLRLLELLVARPIIDIPTVATQLEVTQRTAGLLVNKLKDLGLLTEITGQKRGRRYAYLGLLDALNQEVGTPQISAPGDEEPEEV
jgi:hypothetical protein